MSELSPVLSSPSSSGGGSPIAGTGITVVGSTVSINTAVTVDKTTAQTLTNKTLTAPTITSGTLASPAITTPTGILSSDIGGLGSAATHPSSDFVSSFNVVAKTSTYTVAVNDFVNADISSGSISFPLPTAPVNGSRVGFKISSISGSNTLTFTCGGSDHINTSTGPTSGTLTVLNQVVQLVYTLATNIWTIISTDVPLSQLDARYPILTGLTAHAVLLGEASTSIGYATIGTSGRILIDQGAGVDPTFNALSGDITVTNTGVTAVSKIAGVAVGTPTGTTNVVFSSSPTLTGILTCAAIAASGQIATTAQVAASTSPMYVANTTWTVSAGTGTTTYPQLYVNGGNAPGGWNTSGTGLGINVPGGTATAIDVHSNGGGSLFSVSGAGLVTAAGKITTSYSGAASQSAITTTAAPFAGGNGTTTFPFWFANGASASAATTWSTTGTVFGANIHTSIGAFCDYRIDGASQYVVNGLGKITNINAVATAGWGVPAIYGASRSGTQTNTTVASIATYTCGTSDGSFDVGANVNVTAATAASMTVTCTYTDETNTSRTVTFSFVQNGVAVPIQTITNVTGVGDYVGMKMAIRVKASTAITIATTGTVTGITYKVEGVITQVA